MNKKEMENNFTYIENKYKVIVFLNNKEFENNELIPNIQYIKGRYSIQNWNLSNECYFKDQMDAKKFYNEIFEKVKEDGIKKKDIFAAHIAFIDCRYPKDLEFASKTIYFQDSIISAKETFTLPSSDDLKNIDKKPIEPPVWIEKGLTLTKEEAEEKYKKLWEGLECDEK